MREKLASVDRAPPDLIIVDDLRVSHLKTVQDCDDALSALSMAVIMIESQLEQAREGYLNDGNPGDRTWVRKATTALRLKRLARQQVQTLRATFRKDESSLRKQSKDSDLCDIFKDEFPEQFKVALQIWEDEYDG